MNKNDFTDFLESSFIKWQNQTGKRKTIKEFSEHLGVSRPLLSMWMLGKQRPGSKNIELLADKLGQEVYEALGLPRPDPDLQALQNVWYRIPQGVRRVLREQGEKFIDQDDPQPPYHS